MLTNSLYQFICVLPWNELFDNAYYIIVWRYLPKQGSVTSLSSTLPVPALHMQTMASPPAEALFAGQGAHIGSPEGEAGSMYWFTGQATWRRERSVSIYAHHNVLEVKCAITTQFVGYTATVIYMYIATYIQHIIYQLLLHSLIYSKLASSNEYINNILYICIIYV